MAHAKQTETYKYEYDVSFLLFQVYQIGMIGTTFVPSRAVIVEP